MLSEDEEVRLLALLKIRNKESEYVSFSDFCTRAGYYEPLPKQIDMMHFCINTPGTRMLLGSRGYGKTDYSVIMGIGYKLYRYPQHSFLLVTKSRERNASILDEVKNACEKNGMKFVIANTTSLRLVGKIGKDHSLSAVTIGGGSLRGRHPYDIIMDDPVNEEDISEATRARVQRKYEEAHKLTKNILLIGQPVHKLDLYGRVRELVTKMEMPHGTIPELDHDLDAQRAAGVSDESISASYFLKVISASSTPFENVNYIDEFPKGDSSVAFIDPSFTGGDLTAMTIMRKYFEGVAVKGHAWKRAWYDCIEDIVKALIENNVTHVCFETNTIGEQPVITLQRYLQENGIKGIRVVGKLSLNNKHSRIMAAGQFANLIHIAKNSHKDYILYVKNYEFGAKVDDPPDSLATCMEWIGLIKGKQTKGEK